MTSSRDSITGHFESSLSKNSSGFTIVELLVVIVIIGILAAITIISYTGISNRATVASLTSDLTNASSQLKLFQVDNSNYPTTIDCSQPDSTTNKCFRPSSGTTYNYKSSSTSSNIFCLELTKNSNTYNITQDGQLLAGPCPVLNLDAGNALSYSGTGTTWKDLSGYDNDGTMYGVVPYEKDMTYDFNFAPATSVPSNLSSASTLGFTFVSDMITRTGDFTISTWVKNPAAPDSQTGLFSNAGNADGYRMGVSLQGVYYLIGPNYQEGNIDFLSPMSASTWNNVVVIYGRSTASVMVYLNGVFQRSISIPTSQTIMQNSAPGLVRDPCCTLYNGKIAAFLAYNRALSASEILQIFNSTKARYGL